MPAILRTAALVAATAPAAAFADGHAADPLASVTLEFGQNYLATTLIGQRVHAVDMSEMTIDPATPLPAGTVAEWDDIGEIGDLIVGVDGTLQAVVVDVGGFLGLGEKEVAVRWDALVGVREDDDPSEYFLGLNATQEMLDAAPELERVEADMAEVEVETVEADEADATVTVVEGGDATVVETTGGDAETPAADAETMETDAEATDADAQTMETDADATETDAEATEADAETTETDAEATDAESTDSN